MQPSTPPSTLTRLERRIIAAHALAAGHYMIGIGGRIKPPFDAIVRELVVLRLLTDGSIQYHAHLPTAVDRYARLYMEVANA